MPGELGAPLGKVSRPPPPLLSVSIDPIFPRLLESIKPAQILCLPPLPAWLWGHQPSGGVPAAGLLLLWHLHPGVRLATTGCSDARPQPLVHGGAAAGGEVTRVSPSHGTSCSPCCSVAGSGRHAAQCHAARCRERKGKAQTVLQDRGTEAPSPRFQARMKHGEPPQRNGRGRGAARSPPRSREQTDRGGLAGWRRQPGGRETQQGSESIKETFTAPHTGPARIIYCRFRCYVLNLITEKL